MAAVQGRRLLHSRTRRLVRLGGVLEIRLGSWEVFLVDLAVIMEIIMVEGAEADLHSGKSVTYKDTLAEDNKPINEGLIPINN